MQRIDRLDITKTMKMILAVFTLLLLLLIVVVIIPLDKQHLKLVFIPT